MLCQGKIRKITLAFMLIAMVICPAAICSADDDGDASVMDATPQIKEIPEIGGDGDRDFVGEAEKQYDFIGTVGDVQENGMVLGDTYFKKAPGAKISGGGVGSHVGLKLNKDGEVILCEPVEKARR